MRLCMEIIHGSHSGSEDVPTLAVVRQFQFHSMGPHRAAPNTALSRGLINMVLLENKSSDSYLALKEQNHGIYQTFKML